MRAALAIPALLTLSLAGCGLLKKKTPDAAADASIPDAAALAVDDAGGGDAGTTATAPVPTETPPESTPGGPFQGTYKCGSLWGPMKVSQQGDHVTASHTEANGGVAHVAQCTVVGTKCTGTYKATDTKTMKSKGGGAVTIDKTPKGDLAYKAGSSALATCKKQ